MEVWKTVPLWFNLSSYDDSARFTVSDWYNELVSRLYYFDALMNPHRFINGVPTERANEFFVHIKNHALVSNMKPVDTPMANRFFEKLEGQYQRKREAVENLSERNAYGFLYESDRKEEIENDLSVLRDISDGAIWDRLDERKSIWRKYSYPIANIIDYGNHAFLEINLDASDEQILTEFKDWLSEARGGDIEFLKRQFSASDFDDWRASRVLPYWDLTSFAAINNATIPLHVLGEALFPDEFGVDLTERVRKVTKKKCHFLFSEHVLNALHVQAFSEKMNRNDS